MQAAVEEDCGDTQHSCDDSIDGEMFMRVAEASLERPSFGFSEPGATRTDSAENDEDARQARNRRSRSVQLPASRTLIGIRGAVKHLVNRTSQRRSPETSQRQQQAGNGSDGAVANSIVAAEFDLQAAVRKHMVRRATARLYGATVLHAGWLKKLPRSKSHSQSDASSLWKRRYVTLVRQNRRGPFWQDALLVYHKDDDPGSSPLGFVCLNGALVFVTREDENEGAAFHVVHAIDRESFMSLAADSPADREQWLAAIEKAGVPVKSVFC